MMRFLLPLAAFVISWLLIPQADAQDTLCALMPGGGCVVTDPGTVNGLISAVGQLFLGLVGAAASVFFVWGALNMTVSLGDDSRVSGGKSAMISALLGLGVALGSQIILTFVATPFDGATADLSVLITNIFQAMQSLLKFAFFIAVAVAAFQFVAAYGKSDQIETARRNLLYAAIGAILVNGAGYFISIVTELFAQGTYVVQLLDLMLVEKAYAASPYWQEICAIFHSNCGDANLIGQIGFGVARFVAKFIWGSAIIMVIWGGFKMASSGTGDEGRSEGKQIVTTAVIGFCFGLSADAILNFVSTLIY